MEESMRCGVELIYNMCEYCLCGKMRKQISKPIFKEKSLEQHKDMWMSF